MRWDVSNGESPKWDLLEEKNFRLLFGGVGFFFFLIFAKSVFIVCRQGDGKIGEIKVPSGGDMIKLSMKGRSSFVTLFLRQKRSRVLGDLALFRVGGYLLTYSLFLVVAGVVGAFLFCWGHSIIVVAYARSFCQR